MDLREILTTCLLQRTGLEGLTGGRASSLRTEASTPACWETTGCLTSQANIFIGCRYNLERPSILQRHFFKLYIFYHKFYQSDSKTEAVIEKLFIVQQKKN